MTDLKPVFALINKMERRGTCTPEEVAFLREQRARLFAEINTLGYVRVALEKKQKETR